MRAYRKASTLIESGHDFTEDDDVGGPVEIIGPLRNGQVRIQFVSGNGRHSCFAIDLTLQDAADILSRIAQWEGTRS